MCPKFTKQPQPWQNWGYPTRRKIRFLVTGQKMSRREPDWCLCLYPMIWPPGFLFHLDRGHIYTKSGQLPVFSSSPFSLLFEGQCSTMTDVPCVGDMWENHFSGGLWVAVCRRTCQPQNTTDIFLCWCRYYGVPLLLPQLSEKTDVWFISITGENFYLFGKMGRSILLSLPFVNTTSNGKNVQVEISESKGISQAGQQRQRSFSLWKTGIIVLNDL